MTQAHDLPSSARLLALALITATALGGVVLAGTGGAVAANETNISDEADYYDNQSDAVNNASWYQGNDEASLEGILDMVTRIGAFFIGSGDVDPSGTGYAGTILLGLIVSGVAVGSMVGIGIGPVGGTVLGLVVGYALTAVGLAPVWTRVLLLFGIGIAAAIAIINIVRR